MNLPVAILTKPDELKKRLIKEVTVSRVVNVFDRFTATPLTDAFLALKHGVPLASPLFGIEII